jgi:hypothetical protein
MIGQTMQTSRNSTTNDVQFDCASRGVSCVRIQGIHYAIRYCTLLLSSVSFKRSSTFSKSSHIVGSILPRIKCTSLGFISIRPNGLSLVPCAHHLYSIPYAFVISWLCDTKGKMYSTGIDTNRDANVSQCLFTIT